MSRNTIVVSAHYTISTENTIVLPEGLNTEDVIDLWVKWDTAYIELKDGSTIEVELNNDFNQQEYKNPVDVEWDVQEKTDEELQSEYSVVHVNVDQ